MVKKKLQRCFINYLWGPLSLSERDGEFLFGGGYTNFYLDGLVMCIWDALQFAGGFDVETMRAFQELRDKARSCHVQCHSQQQKLLCRSTTC